MLRFARSALLLLATIGTAAAVELKLPRVSQRASVSQTIGFTDVTITYSRPAVRGRTIWGKLIPYGIVWRTGANEATTISFSDDVTINGRKLPAGRYSLHAILSKDQWTLIFNKVAQQWGSFEYDRSQDALRIAVKPEPSEFQELLTFSIPRVTQTAADVVLQWEKLKVGFTVETDTTAKALANVRAAVAQASADDWETPFKAAAWAFDNDVVPDEASRWVEHSIGIRETFYNLALQAKMLARTGHNREAVNVARRALAAARSAKPQIDSSELERLIEQWEKQT
jgi:hypothetical protein